MCFLMKGLSFLWHDKGKYRVSSTGVMQRAFVLRIAHQNGSLFLSFLFNLLYFFQPDSYHLIRIVSFDHKRKKIFTIKQCLRIRQIKGPLQPVWSTWKRGKPGMAPAEFPVLMWTAGQVDEAMPLALEDKEVWHPLGIWSHWKPIRVDLW